MLLTALVLDNNNFAFTGKIKVRIQKYCPDMPWDMSQNPSMVTEGYDADTGNSGDFDVLVASPFGVGKNSSLFFLPKINSKGLVAPLGHPDSRKFVWVGGIFDTVYDYNSGEAVVTIPSQDTTSDNYYGIMGGAFTDDKNAFVFRTKNTSIDPSYNNLNGQAAKDNVNWDKQHSENLIIISENKIQVRHFSEYNSSGACVIYEDVFIGPVITETNNDGTPKTIENQITVNVINTKISGNELYNTVKISDLGTFLSFSDVKNKIINTLTVDSNALTLTSTIDSKKVSIYKQRGDSVSLNVDNTIITMDKDQISLNGNKAVTVSAPEVRLGAGDGNVLTTKSTLSDFKLPDGTIISVSQKVFG